MSPAAPAATPTRVEVAVDVGVDIHVARKITRHVAVQVGISREIAAAEQALMQVAGAEIPSGASWAETRDARAVSEVGVSEIVSRKIVLQSERLPAQMGIGSKMLLHEIGVIPRASIPAREVRA
ncbi:MAG: hypothetical protein HY288_06185 [Planctomycetia bacterium]|nr:hypothetical protein [Planctomycetia bacterium]